jgi:hypothetical protein
MRHPSKIIESMIFSSLILFSIVGMSGVSIIDAVKLSMFLAIQVSGGAAFWYWVNGYRQIELPEAIGMGIALGTSTTTLTQYLLRETLISDFSWAIPMIFLLPLIWKLNHISTDQNSLKKLDSNYEDVTSLVVIFALTVLAMASLWWWLYPLVLALTFISLILHQSKKHHWKMNHIVYFSLLLSLSGFAASLALSHQNDFWMVASNDQVFSESLSWSLFTWGNNDSPFAAGTPVSYHWFVLLWSGITSSATNADTWVVVSRVLPIVSFFGMFCLIWSMSKRLYEKISAPVIAILFLIFCSNNYGFSLTRYIVSPTFLFSCIWLLAFANTAFGFYRNPSLRNAVLSSFLLFMTFGGKVMNGAVGLSALLFSLFILFFTKKLDPDRVKILILAALSIASLALIYFFMYSKNQPGNINTLTIQSLLPIQLGLLPPAPDLKHLIVVNLFLLASMMMPLVAVGFYAFKKFFRAQFEVWFILGSILSGLILSYFTTNPGSSQLYFWLASTVVASLMVPAIFYDGITTKRELKFLLPLVVFALFAAYVSIEIWSASNLKEILYESLKTKFGGLLISVLILSLAATVFWIFAQNKNRLNLRYQHVLILSVFVLLNMGIGVNQQITKLIQSSQIEASDATSPNLITGSMNQLQVLKWIRSNTDEADVVATNRFCIPGLGYCISKWQLVSAVSHRRMLFEGGYFEIPGIPSYELQNRYLLSDQFGVNPSPIGLKQLCDYGVKWYFYDHSVAEPLKSWEPYATTQIQNEGVSLLRLRCPIS